MNLTKEDIEFMKNYIEIRTDLADVGILGEQEIKICKLFVKILQSIERSDNDVNCDWLCGYLFNNTIYYSYNNDFYWINRTNFKKNNRKIQK